MQTSLEADRALVEMVTKETSLCAETATFQAGLRESLARRDLRRRRPGRSSHRDSECHLGPEKWCAPSGWFLGGLSTQICPP